MADETGERIRGRNLGGLMAAATSCVLVPSRRCGCCDSVHGLPDRAPAAHSSERIHNASEQADRETTVPYVQQLESICSSLLADRSGWVYVRAMAATTTWMGHQPATAVGTTGADMPITICAGMSFINAVPHVTHSG